MKKNSRGRVDGGPSKVDTLAILMVSPGWLSWSGSSWLISPATRQCLRASQEPPGSCSRCGPALLSAVHLNDCLNTCTVDSHIYKPRLPLLESELLVHPSQRSRWLGQIDLSPNFVAWASPPSWVGPSTIVVACLSSLLQL